MFDLHWLQIDRKIMRYIKTGGINTGELIQKITDATIMFTTHLLNLKQYP